MADVPAGPKVVRFGEFEADLRRGQLRKRGLKLRVGRQPFEVLAALLERPGAVVTREELRRRLWPDSAFLDFENNLNTLVARLREALGDSAESPRYIETLPKRGYRFIPSLAGNEAPADRARLLALPFANLSGERDLDYLGDAMTEELIGALAAAAPDRLAVLARTTAMYYRGSPKPAGRIAREVDAAYIVEGSFRRADPRFAAHVQLIRAADESHLWAHRFEFDLGDLLDRQSEAARSIVSRLGLSPRPVSRQTTQDPVAYRFYLQGRAFLWGSTPADLLRAKELLALAAARDPGFALAHVGLAELYWYWGFFGFLPPRQACSEGIYHALHALEIDNSAAETHALLALYRRGLDYCWEEVDREIGCARGLDPQSPFVRMVSAIVEMVHGRLDSAEREARASVELDPLNLFARSWRVFILHLTRDYDRALAEARLLLDLAPANPAAHSVTGFVLRQQGKLTEAIHHHRQAAELSGRSPMMLGWLGLALGLAGERVEARALLDELKVVAEKGKYVPATSFAWTYFALGELEEAFAWMRQAVDSGDLMIAPIKTYPFLDPVRSDPRFLDLLRRMNLTT